MSVKEKLEKKGPRKLLALDGGGIRGMISIEVLARIESMLQNMLGRDDKFVLADYFDYIAGTSTGAIIAAGLSLGMRVDKIRKFYIQDGPAMFKRASVFKILRYKFKRNKLAARLKEVFGPETELGGEELKTLLLLVMRNATTDSPWPLSNNPHAKYNEPHRDDCNLRFPLWQLVRASAAAPVYFPPEIIRVGQKKFIFVDGGVTMYNNPAFQLFLMATLPPYKLGWPTGEREMLLVSIGTGANPRANENLSPREMNLIYNARSLPAALMFAAANEQDLLCRVFGKCLAGAPLDREVGDLLCAGGPVSPKLFTYARYNAELTREGLDALELKDIDPRQVQKLDSVAHIAELQKIGRAVAEKEVFKAHFENFK